MKCLNLLLVVILTVFLFGCLEKPETDVPPERIYTTYSLYYDELLNQTFASAIFSADTREGWRQELTGSSRVEFNGNELMLEERFDEYVVSFDDVVTFGEFLFRDKNGEEYFNTAEIKIIGYPSGLDSISTGNDYIFRWAGDPLEENEFVTLSFEEESLGVLAIFQQEDPGAESVTVPKSELVKLGFGEVNIRVAWEKIVDTDQHPGAGGEVHTTAVLQPKPVVIY